MNIKDIFVLVPLEELTVIQLRNEAVRIRRGNEILRRSKVSRQLIDSREATACEFEAIADQLDSGERPFAMRSV